MTISPRQPRYPVFVPSRGRAALIDREYSTAHNLMEDGVPFRMVVEEAEADEYARRVGEERVLVLPFSGRGTSTPARNWIREFAEAEGHARHWQLDDNINEFRRLYDGRRIPCHAGIALRVCEDLSDRFENVAISGLNYQMFVPPDTPVPFYLNVHVYSCTLVNHSWEGRWRLDYNEDTDLCLQALVGGWCTLALNAFMANKQRTMTTRGGNTESLYNSESGASDTDGRFVMARVLERAWPGVVKTTRKFGRYQHSVNWRQFSNELRLRDGLDLAALPPVDEYGMTLRPVKEIRSPAIRDLYERYTAMRSETAPGPVEEPEAPVTAATRTPTPAARIVYTDDAQTNTRLYAHARCPGTGGHPAVWRVPLDDALPPDGETRECPECVCALPVEPYGVLPVATPS
jgi:hypothetical protein